MCSSLNIIINEFKVKRKNDGDWKRQEKQKIGVLKDPTIVFSFNSRIDN